MALLGIPLTQQQTVNDPQQPFIWGQGGRRLTADDIAQQRLVADQQRVAGADFSPAGSVWEGLGRVVSGLNSSYYRNDAERQAARNAEESQNVIAQLLAQPAEGVDPNAGIAAALANPYISDEARQIALQQHQRLNPEPVEDKDSIVRLSRIANDPTQPEWLRLDAQNQIDVLNDPLSVITNSAGTQILPRSVLLNMGGGDPASGAVPGALPPDTLPPDFDFDAEPVGVLQGASASQSITPQEAEIVRSSLGPDGQAEFEDWLRRNNIVIVGQ